MALSITRRIALALTLSLAAPAGALAFPDGPVKIIVPTDPGGAMDGLARVFQKAFETSDLLGDNMPVINMAGAGGTIGTREIKDAAPDGQTIGIWHDGIVTSKAMGVVDYDHNDFALIGATGYADLGLAVSAKAPFSTFEEMITYAKENPGEVTVAVNIGLPVHFVPMRVATDGGLELRYVQVGGGAKRYQSLVGGHTDIAIFSVQELLKFGGTGIEPLVMLTDERVEALPDTPTAKEYGIDVVAPSQRIWLAPKGIDADKLETLRSAFKEAMAREDVAKQLEGFGLNAVFVDADTVDQRLADARDATMPLVPKAREAAN
ncbi:MAG: tripartite tricarboxylate transporter substrate binding protein [Acuticoccus sp.]